MLSYNKALQEAGKLAIISHCDDTCDNAFNSALKDEKRLCNLLLEPKRVIFELRQSRKI